MAQSKPRLLVLASTYPRWAGDTEPGFVHELARRLTTEFDVLVVGPHAPGAQAFEILDGVSVERYRYAPSRFESLVNNGGIATNLKRARWKWLLLPGFMAAQAWATWRAIVRFRPQVVHAHWLVPQGVTIAMLRMLDPRTPRFLVTSHGGDLFSLRSWPMRQLKRFVLKRASAVTVVSSAMREPVLNLGADPARLSIEPMGVDLQGRFTPGAVPPAGPPRLLFVGRLVEKKGLSHLIGALPRVLDAFPDAGLDIVGFGPEEAALRDQVRACGLDGHVEFLGALPQERLPALYRRAAVFVAPFVAAADGDQEGLGLVLVEAAGCGCPVVAGDVPAVRDVVTSPVTGRVVSARNAAQLSEALVAVLTEGRSAEADSSRARSVDAFDWASRARAYSRLLGAQGGR